MDHFEKSSLNLLQHVFCFTFCFFFFFFFLATRHVGRRRKWQPTPVFSPGESQGWGSLVGCSPWGCEESDTTEQLHFAFSLSCIGEGNGNPLQCSCLENPRDGGAWWAAVHGVAKSWTRLSNFTFTFHFHALEKEMATRSSVLAWRIPGTGEPGGLPSMGSHRVGHDRSDSAAAGTWVTSQTRDWTHTRCSGSQRLDHWTTRAIPHVSLTKKTSDAF